MKKEERTKIFCNICDRIFYNKKSMTNHRRNHDKDFRKKISNSMKGRNKREKNGMWKGKNVGYNALHDFIKYNKKKSKTCEECKKEKRLDLANLSGEYTRDLDDWKWLCRGCHMKFDYKLGMRTSGGKKN